MGNCKRIIENVSLSCGKRKQKNYKKRKKTRFGVCY